MKKIQLGSAIGLTCIASTPVLKDAESSEVKISLPASSSLAGAEGMPTNGVPMPLGMTLQELHTKAKLPVETPGNAVEAWSRMGPPEPPTRGQTAQSTSKEILHADKPGQFVFERTVEPWNLILIREQ